MYDLRRLIALIFLSILALRMDAQSNMTWYVECEKEVFEQATFEVTFTLMNAEGKNVKFPSFDHFDVLSGPSTSRSMTIINGSRSSSSTFSFVLSAPKIGNYLLGSATIEVKGKTLKTEPINIAVVKSNLSSADLPKGDVEAIAKMKVAPMKAYTGQQIMAQYLIYYGENIGFSEEPLKPNFEGFFIKDLNVAQASISGVQVGNKRYEGILVDAVALYPQKAGLLKIGATNYKIQKRNPGSNPFHNPFSGYIEKTLKTNEETIDVKALPQGAPATFTGGVGEYNIETNIDKTSLTTNESIALRLTVVGNGDSRQVGPPIQNFGSDFEVFPAKLVGEEEYINNNVVWHKKIFEYLVTPKREGTFTLSPIFTFFNPNQEKYQTLDAKTTSFSVKKESKSISQFFAGNRQTDGSKNKFPTWIIWLLIPLILSFAYWWMSKKSNKNASMSEAQLLELKKKNAGQLALAKLSTAQKLMDEHQHALFYKEIGFAINNYLQSKYTISTENLNKQYVYQFLANTAKGELIPKEYIDILEKADLSMYAGYSDKNVEEIFNRAKNFISSCELD